jgi:predicted nucleic acid-binding protein
MKAFLDTNVLVYTFDAGAPDKRQRALALFSECAAEGTLLLSVQVLQEFYVTVTRKLDKPLDAAVARAVVNDLTAFPVVPTDVPMVRAAIRTHQDAAISFWDALIVEAARSGGASRLYSEDLQDGRDFGGLQVINPFTDRSPAKVKKSSRVKT